MRKNQNRSTHACSIDRGRSLKNANIVAFPRALKSSGEASKTSTDNEYVDTAIRISTHWLRAFYSN